MANRTQLRAFLKQVLPDDDLVEGYRAIAPSSMMEAAAEIPAPVQTALEKARSDHDLAPEDQYVLEAIVLPDTRPVIDVLDGDYTPPATDLIGVGDPTAHALLRTAIASIGRIGVPALPQVPFAGTGFVVGPDLLMTNRHVADLFAAGLGREGLVFRPGHTADLDLLAELDRPSEAQVTIESVLAIHPHWDMALLRTRGLDHEAHPTLTLSTRETGDLFEAGIAVVGYPAYDRRNPADLQNEIFRGRFGVKRLQPGLAREVATVGSFGHQVEALTHDASTLGGNSGSAVIDLSSGKVVGLHFGGQYLLANYAVPSRELARDPFLADMGVVFDDPSVVQRPSPWLAAWQAADRAPGEAPPPASPPVPSPASPPAATATTTINVPLEITVRIGDVTGPAVAVAGPVGGLAAPEGIPWHDDELESRTGYDPEYLGTTVPMATVSDPTLVSGPAPDDPELRYEHFSLVMNRVRRIAFVTASNVTYDTAFTEPEPGRDYTREALSGTTGSETWFLDPRIPAVHQLPDRFFTRDRGAFDKGHIVRRDDVAWGTSYDQVRRGNGDSYHVTNCSPQVMRFNQKSRGGIWGAFEDEIKDQATASRFTIFAGPVLRDDDPPFHGVDLASPIVVAIPRSYWKVIVSVDDEGELRSFGFVLEQDLSDVRFEETTGGFEVTAPWRRFHRSIADIQAAIDPVVLPDVVLDADQPPPD